MKKLLSVVFGLAVLVGFSMTSANAKTLKCQTVLNTKADEVKMLKDFTDTVTELTDGSLKFRSQTIELKPWVEFDALAIKNFPPISIIYLWKNLIT